MRSINPGCVNFLDKKDVRFKSLHEVMDAHFHQLHLTGIGRDVKPARVLTTDDEEDCGRVVNEDPQSSSIFHRWKDVLPSWWC